MEHQILSPNAGLRHLEQSFPLFIKNNPALLSAKFNDLIQTLQDRIHSLQDTLQMLQLQKLSTNTFSSAQLFNLYEEVKQMAKVNKLFLLKKGFFPAEHIIQKSKRQNPHSPACSLCQSSEPRDHL